jgi:hypothetical protein
METKLVYLKENPDSKEEDIEEELISALEEIDKIRKTNIKLKEQFPKHEKHDHDIE